MRGISKKLFFLKGLIFLEHKPFDTHSHSVPEIFLEKLILKKISRHPKLTSMQRVKW